MGDTNTGEFRFPYIGTATTLVNEIRDIYGVEHVALNTRVEQIDGDVTADIKYDTELTEPCQVAKAIENGIEKAGTVEFA